MTKKIKSKVCKFCKQKFEGFEFQAFCSDICKHDYDRVHLYKKFGRGPSYEYICRALTAGNKTGNAYGITIPRELVEKHNLFHKKFKVSISKKGIFSIKTKIEYKEL